MSNALITYLYNFHITALFTIQYSVNVVLIALSKITPKKELLYKLSTVKPVSKGHPLERLPLSSTVEPVSKGHI